MLNGYFRMERENYKGEDIFIYCFENNDYIKANNLTLTSNVSNFNIDNYINQRADLVKFITIPQPNNTAITQNNNSVSIQMQLDPVIRYIEHNFYKSSINNNIYEFVYELDVTHERIYIVIEATMLLPNDLIFALLRDCSEKMIIQSQLYINNKDINNKN